MIRSIIRGICLLGLCAASMPAQTTLGTITGRVLDSTGATLANATVAATNTGTGVVYRTNTNDAGNYVLQQLAIGTYELAVEAKGFRKFVQKNIELSVAQTLSIDATLELGQLEQVIEITADTSTLQTATSDLGTIVQNKKLVDLPLFVGGNIRNLEQFIFLAPGVTGDTGNTQISGSPSRGKEILVDGIASTGAESGGVIPGSARPIGRNHRGVSSSFAPISMRSTAAPAAAWRSSRPNRATNDFHGAAFDYLRNDKFDARGFYQRTRPINRQNEFGAALGGPVRLPASLRWP